MDSQGSGRARRGVLALIALVTAALAVAAGSAAAGSREPNRQNKPTPQRQTQPQRQPQREPQKQPQSPAVTPLTFEARSLDGSGNNLAHPSWGQVGTPYRRVARANYGDGVATLVGGPNARYVSNRVFNDLAQNLFSERGMTQFAWTWGQFMDHTFGLAQDSSESTPITFNQSDPLEDFQNDLGSISFKRDAAAPGTGTSSANPRQQTNTVSSYIDGWSVYGGTAQRLDWLRSGSLDGDPTNNSATLLLTSDNYLPRATTRGDAASAPKMATEGQLAGHPQDRVVAGDVRANENIALTGVHTLFAREHNRIVNGLPASLTDEQKFQIARRVVGAEQQFVTYNEFLPSLGVRLERYRGYRPGVDASLGNEFATVAYRAHSMIHGEFDVPFDPARYSQAQIDRFNSEGIQVEPSDDGDGNQLTVPLNAAFFNPDLVPQIGEGPIMESLSKETQYKNDEQIDNSLRSVLFKVPGPNAPDPAACFMDPRTQGCFQGVVDLGAIDVQRGRDHGMPGYNQMRRTFGLRRVHSFHEITGERSQRLPRRLTINTRGILDFVKLFDAEGKPVELGSDAAKNDAVVGVRKTTLAARLKAIYGSPDKVDAFVGMIAERHLRGAEFGPLQYAVWRQQFQALRDGDRFFYLNDPALQQIQSRYGISFKHRLSELIALNTDVPQADLPENVFLQETAAQPHRKPGKRERHPKSQRRRGH